MKLCVLKWIFLENIKATASTRLRALLLILKVVVVRCCRGEITEVIEKDTSESALLSRKL